MTTRLIRVLLVFIAVALVAAASYFLRQIDTTLVAERAASDSLRDQARTLAATIAEMRTAQVAYVARGQGEDFWMGRVNKLLPVVQRQMADFGGELASPAAQEAFEPASAAMDNFQKLDSRAQGFVKGGNGLLAADLIFTDGLEATTTARNQIDAALNEEMNTRQAGLTEQRRLQLAVLGGAGAGVLLMLMILALTGAASIQAEAPVGLLAHMAQEPAQPVAEHKAVTQNLSNAAQLCTELGRVVEPRQLPVLLKRTAEILDASGIIVWVAEPAGNCMKPAMSFGYADQVISRMGSIHRDANNAAAAAYRTGEMRTVNGALVMPLLTSDGCVGVVSAEMMGGSEKDESSQALAAIFAAQLATIVSPPPSTADVKTAINS
ncbi:MAG: hypothetical protein ND807_05725 [Vicinamibacterales bacterium]|nr:hypothetical protein [Vicinamibacterales bacterium]